MKKDTIYILLADDDLDDCDFFNEALAEIGIGTELSVVHNGVELMDLLASESAEMPDILFLDLNMPLMTGYECLLEIKESDRLKNLPVVIFSTSYNPDMANTLYECGANYYIRKPASFSDLIKVLKQTLLKVTGDRLRRPSRGSFLIQL